MILNAIKRLNHWVDQVEEKICELEDRSFEIVQSEKVKNEQKEMKKAYGIDGTP